MNAIASQLEDQDIENVATFFASLPGVADSATKSELLPNIAQSRISFPADYKTRFTKYLTMNFPDDKQVRFFMRALRQSRPRPQTPRSPADR